MPWRDTSQLVKQKVSHRQKCNCACHNPCDTNKNENLFSDTCLHKTTSSRQFVKIPAAMMPALPATAGLQRIWTAVILSLRLHFNSLKTLQAILLLEFPQQFY